jgi:hypothetical protein
MSQPKRHPNGGKALKFWNYLPNESFKTTKFETNIRIG